MQLCHDLRDDQRKEVTSLQPSDLQTQHTKTKKKTLVDGEYGARRKASYVIGPDGVTAQGHQQASSRLPAKKQHSLHRHKRGKRASLNAAVLPVSTETLGGPANTLPPTLYDGNASSTPSVSAPTFVTITAASTPVVTSQSHDLKRQSA